MKNIYTILREGACALGVVVLGCLMTWLFLLFLGIYSLADGGTDSCARMAAAILKACGSLIK